MTGGRHDDNVRQQLTTKMRPLTGGLKDKSNQQNTISPVCSRAVQKKMAKMKMNLKDPRGKTVRGQEASGKSRDDLEVDAKDGESSGDSQAPDLTGSWALAAMRGGVFIHQGAGRQGNLSLPGPGNNWHLLNSSTLYFVHGHLGTWNES